MTVEIKLQPVYPKPNCTATLDVRMYLLRTRPCASTNHRVSYKHVRLTGVSLSKRNNISLLNIINWKKLYVSKYRPNVY